MADKDDIVIHGMHLTLEENKEYENYIKSHGKNVDSIKPTQPKVEVNDVNI